MKFVQLKREYKGRPVGERISVDADDAQLLIQAGIADDVAHDPLPELLQRSAAGLFANFDKAMTAAFEDLIRRFAVANAKSRKNGIPEIFGDGNTGDKRKTFGAFLLAVRTRNHKALEEMESEFVQWDDQSEKAALNTNVGAQGGYLVPTQHYNNIMTVALENSIVRPRAIIIPMTARMIEVPYLDITSIPTAGDSAFLGGLVGRWTEEGTTLNESEPLFKQAELRNYELSGFSKISNSLNQDVPALEGFLYQLFGTAAAWYEDYAFVRGNGVGKPMGVLTWPGLISITRSAASAFTLADSAAMLARWLGNYDTGKCCWVGHPTTMAKYLTMYDGAGNLVNGGPNINGKPNMQLHGLPWAVSEKVPSLNTAGDVLLADFGKYIIGDRRQMEIAYSEHAGFATNQTLWRFVTRVAGMPWMRDKVTLSDASSTLSPFVVLAAG